MKGTHSHSLPITAKGVYRKEYLLYMCFTLPPKISWHIIIAAVWLYYTKITCQPIYCIIIIYRTMLYILYMASTL